jgi:type I restriction enzyme S subunit
LHSGDPATSRPLSDLASVNPPSTLADTVASFVPMAAVSEEGHLIDHFVGTRPTSAAAGFTQFQRDDTLLAKITPCFENGKAARFQRYLGEGFGSTEFHVLRSKEPMHRDLVFHVIHSREFRHRVEASMTGSAGQRRVSTRAVEEFPVTADAMDHCEQASAALNAAMESRRALQRRLEQLELVLVSVRSDLLAGRVRT